MTVMVEFNGQLVNGHVVRSWWFLRRVQMHTSDGYFLAWVPRWRVFAVPSVQPGEPT